MSVQNSNRVSLNVECDMDIKKENPVVTELEVVTLTCEPTIDLDILNKNDDPDSDSSFSCDYVSMPLKVKNTEVISVGNDSNLDHKHSTLVPNIRKCVENLQNRISNEHSTTHGKVVNGFFTDVSKFDLREFDTYLINSSFESNTKLLSHFQETTVTDNDGAILRGKYKEKLEIKEELCEEERTSTCDENNNELENGVSAVPESLIHLIPEFKCNDCDKLFLTRRGLSIHAKVHNRNRYECQICEDTFDTKTFLSDHYQYVHLIDGKYQCDRCTKSFRVRAGLVYHIHTTHKRERYVCQYCQKTYAPLAVFKLHLRNMEDFGSCTPFNCAHCWRTFSDKTVLERHLKQHSKIFRCQHCTETFVGINLYDEHVRSHFIPLPRVSCDVCGKSYNFISGLNRHRRQEHQELIAAENTNRLPKYKYFCDLCSKTFAEGTYFRMHVASHRENKKYLCHECGKSYSMKVILKYHIRNVHDVKSSNQGTNEDCTTNSKNISEENNVPEATKSQIHTQKKPVYFCNVCNKTFSLKSYYRMHAASHTEGKKYLCHKCGKRYDSKILLNSHIRFAHSDNVNNQKGNRRLLNILYGGTGQRLCKHCGEAVSLKCYRRHLRIHNELRPFLCHICGKTLRSRASFRVHLRAMHFKDDPLRTARCACRHCGRVYSCHASLRRHIRQLKNRNYAYPFKL